MEEAPGVATSAGVWKGHDVPPDVLTDVVFWLQKACYTGQGNASIELEACRTRALEGPSIAATMGAKLWDS